MIQILPGTQVKVAAGQRETSLSVTGTVAMPLELDWGEKVTVIRPGADTRMSLGYAMNSEELKCVNEVLGGAEKLILYRLNGSGEKAKAALTESIAVTAKYPGKRGNDITVSVEPNGSAWDITTLLGTFVADTQTVSNPEDFTANDLVELEGSGDLSSAVVKLTGGSNGTVGEDDWSAFQAEMEKQEFNVLCYVGTDLATAKALIGWVKQQRQKNNMIQMVQSVVAANHPAVYYSTIGGKTSDYSLSAAQACATMAGLLAQQGVKGSLTHFNRVSGWLDVSRQLTREQQEAKVQAGEILFVMLYGVPAVLYDINSLTTFTEECPKDFSKGLVMRTLDQYARELQKLLDSRVIGKVRNDQNGRAQVKSMILEMTVQNYLNQGYIEGFTADDISVTMAADRDAVTAGVAIRVADTVDKIQITVTAA